MYYIYHIPGVKIGCTNNVKRRIKQQGFTEYEVLEIHTDEKIASIREKELQKQYGLEESNVKTDYSQQIRFAKAGQAACKGKPNKGTQMQIKNKIGIFGYSKDERLELNKKASIIGANRAKEVLSHTVNVYDYKTNKFITQFYSINEAARQLKLSSGNIKSIIKGNRNHTKGYTFKKLIK